MAIQINQWAGHMPGPLQLHHPQIAWVPHQHARVTWHSLPPDPRPCRELFDSRERTFYLFSQLPLELRLKIWAYMAPKRVIELRSWGDRTNNPYVPIKFSVARHSFPIVLHINQESRREGLRFYKRVKIGVSTTILERNRKYIPWQHHPQNPNAGVSLEVSRYYFPLVLPFRAQELYIDFTRDIIYLGPEFKHQHLKDFLTATGPGTELADVQHLALDRKLWVSGGVQYRGTGFGSGFEYLREALYSLSKRPLKTLYIIPDDERNSLANEFYYRKHEITLQTPPYQYEFRPEGQAPLANAKTVVENLEEWMQRLWMGRGVPKIEIMSLRRDNREMMDFKTGIWEVQRLLGDMAAWKTWVPRDT